MTVIGVRKYYLRPKDYIEGHIICRTFGDNKKELCLRSGERKIRLPNNKNEMCSVTESLRRLCNKTFVIHTNKSLLDSWNSANECQS